MQSIISTTENHTLESFVKILRNNIDDIDQKVEIKFILNTNIFNITKSIREICTKPLLDLNKLSEVKLFTKILPIKLNNQIVLYKENPCYRIINLDYEVPKGYFIELVNKVSLNNYEINDIVIVDNLINFTINFTHTDDRVIIIKRGDTVFNFNLFIC